MLVAAIWTARQGWKQSELDSLLPYLRLFAFQPQVLSTHNHGVLNWQASNVQRVGFLSCQTSSLGTHWQQRRLHLAIGLGLHENRPSRILHVGASKIQGAPMQSASSRALATRTPTKRTLNS